MVDRLNKIRSRFDEIVKDHKALKLREIDGVRLLNNRTLRLQAGPVVDEKSIFGRDADVTEVINLLLSKNENSFSVISIIGKGGLGKTTIAQLVYNDARVRQHFDLFGWVCVSEKFDVGRMIKATLESFTRNRRGLSWLSPLQEELVKLVKDKKILLVLDDVWNENQGLWELFRSFLSKAKWVRILVTTRNEKVAEVMLTTERFMPDYLPEDSCWQLFQHFAFGSRNYVVPTHFVDMGREIMRKCGGIPLAVKSIASLLRHKTDAKSWREILESNLWESKTVNDIFPALHFSYAHLPVHLKPCFLFCSMYPKDHRLEKNNLIELWISHGYIGSQGKRTTVVGVEYYEELKERSFLDDFSDEFTAFCKLHDIIHDLARLNSENEHYSMDISQPLEENIPQEAYHLYATGFMGFVNQIPQQNLKGLRTLSTELRGCTGDSEHQYCKNSTDLEAMDLNLNLSGGYEDCWLTTSKCILNLKKFEVLRVLELKVDHLREIPDSISQLKHLTYLRIESDWLEMLPESIGLLYNLQTLILDCFISPLEYLPESIGYLANLQYLCIECSEFNELPESLSLISNLQRLVIKSDELEKVPLDFRKLCNLQELTIDSKKLEEVPDKLDCLSCLEELEFPSVDTLSELPGTLGKCHKLKTLKAYDCLLEFNSHSLENFPAMMTMAACLGVETIGWLKDMKDLEGELIIEGLRNMSKLEDARLANLRSKCKIETLNLCWHDLRKHEHLNGWNELTIRLLKDPNEDTLIGEDLNLSLLECLRPHRHLKKLVLEGYPSAILPGWIGDPLSMQAIQEIRLIGCDGLQSLPFSNLQTLKHFKFQSCSGFQVLNLEQLPFQLENLEISWCEELKLITGLQNLEKLAALEINCCKVLKLITMDEHGLQLAESTEAGGSSSHEKPRGHQQRTLSLTRLVILCCPLLRGLPYKLERSLSCTVWWVYGCGFPSLHFGGPSVRQ
jgi:NB-ARC domain